MPDVTIGGGTLAGKGVYAARDFRAGEVVVGYDLRELTQAEFDALPSSEREWTHSFWGGIFLFPEPARYVNHDDNPTTFPDLSRMGNVALRPIRKGEAITIDDRVELGNELATFLEAYERAIASRRFDAVAPLIADQAVYWVSTGAYHGKVAICQLFDDAWTETPTGTTTISDIAWVAANYWVSACTYRCESAGVSSRKRSPLDGGVTSVLRRIAGSWRVVHQHVSPLV